MDSNPSLTAKASLAYFNGYFWTTLADIRVLALIFFFLASALWLYGVETAPYAMAAFIVLVLLSFWGSAVATKRHMNIGNEQIEIIEQLYQKELAAKLGAIRAKHDPKRDSDNAQSA